MLSFICKVYVCYIYFLNAGHYTKNNMHKHNKGFTLVEILIVIVVIAILAAVTMVAYNGLVGRAQDSMAQAGLSTAKKELTLYHQENGSYPAANECPNPSAGNICLSSQRGTTFVYTPNNSTNPPSYTLVARLAQRFTPLRLLTLLLTVSVLEPQQRSRT